MMLTGSATSINEKSGKPETKVRRGFSFFLFFFSFSGVAVVEERPLIISLQSQYVNTRQPEGPFCSRRETTTGATTGPCTRGASGGSEGASTSWAASSAFCRTSGA